MKNITERQKNILEKVVQEYIKTASPVSSNFLKEKCRLPVSSATVRMDFAELTKAGFLRKNYISGGRVPTDKGYRFFVDRLFEKEVFEKEEQKIIEEFQLIFKQVRDLLLFSRQITKNIATFSSNLGISYIKDFNIFWKEGWEGIFQTPEFRDIQYLKKFTRLVDDFETNIEKFDTRINGGKERVKIYIGKESPFKRKEFSIIAGKSSNSKNKVTFAILGPKRMNFRRNISLIEGVIKTVEKLS